jgi:hypothetical protein
MYLTWRWCAMYLTRRGRTMYLTRRRRGLPLWGRAALGRGTIAVTVVVGTSQDCAAGKKADDQDAGQ